MHPTTKQKLNTPSFRHNGTSQDFLPNGLSINSLEVKSSFIKSYRETFQRNYELPARSILTEEATREMTQGTIPNLEALCKELNDTLKNQNTTLPAIPVLKAYESIRILEEKRFLNNPTTNHVLVRNDFMKIVLIHWQPGKFSSIHGHAVGGCVFKVLKGSLVEKRYSPDEEQQFMAISTFTKGSMAYIDDDMAYHAVGNPFDSSAISIHVYTH